MNEIETNGKIIIAVPIEKEAKDFRIAAGFVVWLHGSQVLPQGQFKIVGKLTELTEEQAGEYVKPNSYKELVGSTSIGLFISMLVDAGAKCAAMVYFVGIEFIRGKKFETSHAEAMKYLETLPHNFLIIEKI